MKRLVVWGLCFVLGACVSAEQYASVYANQRPPTAEERQAVLAQIRVTLFDPYSVRDATISNVLAPSSVITASKNAKAVCVRLNAKNRFGAYVGLTYTMYKFSAEGALLAADDTPIAQQECADARLGYMPFTELEAV